MSRRRAGRGGARTRYPDVLVARGEVDRVVEREQLLEALAWLRDEPTSSSASCRSVTATHWPGRDPAFWVAYELRSLPLSTGYGSRWGARGRRTVPSVTPMFPTANWHERETFDFYGIVFDGHPDLTRILLPDDWEGYPAAQGRAARGRAHVVPRRDDAAGRRAGHGVSDASTVMSAALDAAGESPDFRDPATGEVRQETMIINMGPQHPSTHGVLRLLLELDGETVIRCKPVIGYLHTGIEKNTEYRTWVQGVTYVTRADYLAPFFNELAYCLAVERLLGVEAPARAQLIRVLVCELNRITSHLVWLATSGLELGAVSMMLYGLREREMIMDIFEALTGLRMNHAYIRIGGVVMDLPEDGPRKIRELIDILPSRIDEYETLLNDNPIWRERNEGVGGALGRAAASRSASPARPAGGRGRRRTCARTCRTAATRRSTSTCRPAPRATPTRATACGSTRCASR